MDKLDPQTKLQIAEAVRAIYQNLDNRIDAVRAILQGLRPMLAIRFVWSPALYHGDTGTAYFKMKAD